MVNQLVINIELKSVLLGVCLVGRLETLLTAVERPTLNTVNMRLV